jgi:hypothetical protein
MFDEDLVLSILVQIDGALRKIADRAGRFPTADDFTLTCASAVDYCLYSTIRRA